MTPRKKETKERGEFKKTFGLLNDRVCIARYDWAVYSILYINQDNFGIIQSVAEIFWTSNQIRERNAIILSLARLFDTPNPKQANLTLYLIIELMRPFAEPAFVTEIEDRVKAAEILVAPLRLERHQRIAHLDKDIALLPRLWGDVTSDQIEEVLKSVEGIVDHIDKQLRGVTHFRDAYVRMAENHVGTFLKKLAVIADMDEVELELRMQRLSERQNLQAPNT
jgi:hypothetical protein